MGHPQLCHGVAVPTGGHPRVVLGCSEHPPRVVAPAPWWHGGAGVAQPALAPGMSVQIDTQRAHGVGVLHQNLVSRPKRGAPGSARWARGLGGAPRLPAGTGAVPPAGLAPRWLSPIWVWVRLVGVCLFFWLFFAFWGLLLPAGFVAPCPAAARGEGGQEVLGLGSRRRSDRPASAGRGAAGVLRGFGAGQSVSLKATPRR